MNERALREEFPLLATCTYLNACGAGPVPRGIEDVLSSYARALFRYRDSIWVDWWAALRRFEGKLATLLGAEPETIVLDANLSALLGRLLSAVDFRGERNRIVTTDLEFPTVRFVARGFARHGAEVIVVPSADGLAIDGERVAQAIDERTAIALVSLATYQTGALTDLAPIVKRARSVGARVAIDAYAAVGAVPIDVRALGVDALLGGAHKWLCGSYECGFMYVSKEAARDLEPAATGWMASDDPLSFGEPTKYASGARRFSAGTPAVLPALVSEVGLDLLQSMGMGDIRRRSLERTRRILVRARDAGMEIVAPVDDARRGAIAAVRFPGCEIVARTLVERGFVCSHRGALRIAPHVYNTEEEIDAFMDAMITLARTVPR